MIKFQLLQPVSDFLEQSAINKFMGTPSENSFGLQKSATLDDSEVNLNE